MPRTFLKMTSLRLSGLSASRLIVEGGIQRCSVDRERISSLEGIESFSLGVWIDSAPRRKGCLMCVFREEAGEKKISFSFFFLMLRRVIML